MTGIPVNDLPTSTAPASITGTEDTSIAFTGGNALTVADVDGTNLTVTLSATNGTLTMTTLTGLAFTVGDGTADVTMTFSGTQAALNSALATLSYAPTADFNGAAAVTFSVTDGVAGPVVKVVNLTITAVADIVADSVTTLEDTPITFNAITGTNGASADNVREPGARGHERHPGHQGLRHVPRRWLADLHPEPQHQRCRQLHVHRDVGRRHRDRDGVDDRHPVNDAPIAGADSFDTIGNTELRVDLAAGTTPAVTETTGPANGVARQ